MYNRLKFIRTDCDYDLFKYRFKREPRVWSIDQVHDLWIRSSERASIRGKESSKVYDKIINEIPKNKNGYKKIYFTENDKVYEYSFSWSSQFKSWGYSWNKVTFSDKKNIARDEKIDFILSNRRAFELGEEWRNAKKMECKLQRRVFSIMCEMVEDKLRKFYKDKFPPHITKVKISDKYYYFAVDDQHRYEYLKFHFKGESTDEFIDL